MFYKLFLLTNLNEIETMLEQSVIVTSQIALSRLMCQWFHNMSTTVYILKSSGVAVE